jgi:hypothetical protein
MLQRLFHLALLVAYGTFYSNRDTVPQFLMFFFAKSSARLQERLKIIFNACARYIYGISRFQHISEYTNRILGMPLDVNYDWRICCMMHRLIEGRGPEYLSDLLQFGRSTHLRIFITPAHRRIAPSFFIQGQSYGTAYQYQLEEWSAGLGKCVIFNLNLNSS